MEASIHSSILGRYASVTRRRARRFGDRPAGVPGRDMPGNRVVRAARELRGGAQRPGQIVGSKNFHDFSVRLHKGLFLGRHLVRLDTAIKPRGEAPAA